AVAVGPTGTPGENVGLDDHPLARGAADGEGAAVDLRRDPLNDHPLSCPLGHHVHALPAALQIACHEEPKEPEEPDGPGAPVYHTGGRGGKEGPQLPPPPWPATPPPSRARSSRSPEGRTPYRPSATLPPSQGGSPCPGARASPAVSCWSGGSRPGPPPSRR